MKKFIKHKLCSTLPRGKKRLIQRFGRWYYEPLNDADFEARFDSLVKIVPKLNDESEFDALCADTQNERYQLDDGMPFRFVLVEDSHIPNSSILMVCINHCFGDGITWIGCINAVAENGFEDLAKFRHDIGFNPVLELAGMARGIKYFFELLMSIDSGKKSQPDPKREYVFSREFEMAKMKGACKGMKAPFQASFFAILSMALAEFYRRHDVKDDKITIASAFSLKPIITKRDEMRSCNNIVQSFTDLQISDDVMTAVKKVPKPDFVGAYGMYYRAAILTNLPFGYGAWLLAKARPAKNVWFAYSSVPIAMNHLVVNGSKMTASTSILRPGAKGSCSICAGTVGNSMTYAMVADKDKNYRELLEIIEQKTDEFINAAQSGK